jgi:hypothetical protein
MQHECESDSALHPVVRRACSHTLLLQLEDIQDSLLPLLATGMKNFMPVMTNALRCDQMECSAPPTRHI